MASVVSEAVFVQVGLQVLHAHVVINPTDSPLNSAEEPFDSVGVSVARDIYPLAVTNAPMVIAQLL